MTERYRVSVKRPREKDGSYWLLRVRPPASSGEKEKVRRSDVPVTSDRALVDAKARELEDELNAGYAAAFPETAAPRVTTFGIVYKLHLAWRENDTDSSPGTRTYYRTNVIRLSKTRLWETDVQKLDRATILNTRDDLVRLEYDPNTINTTLRSVGYVWEWARERNLVNGKSWADLRPKKALKLSPKKKRPYTDAEVALVLEDLRTFRGTNFRSEVWYPFFCVLADTAARAGAVCKLTGADLDREGNRVFLRTKGKQEWVAIPAETMQLVPETEHDSYVFTCTRSRGENKRLYTQVTYNVLKKALARVGIKDPKKLDQHSFRRRWIATAHRAGIPTDLSMKQAMHTSLAVHMAYQEGAIGDDHHAVVEAVRARRIAKAEPSNPPRSPARSVSGEAVAPPAAASPASLPGAPPIPPKDAREVNDSAGSDSACCTQDPPRNQRSNGNIQVLPPNLPPPKCAKEITRVMGGLDDSVDAFNGALARLIDHFPKIVFGLLGDMETLTEIRRIVAAEYPEAAGKKKGRKQA